MYVESVPRHGKAKSLFIINLAAPADVPGAEAVGLGERLFFISFYLFEKEVQINYNLSEQWG